MEFQEHNEVSDEEVFDIEILNTEIPETLKAFMDLHGISLKHELPPLFPGVKKLGLKNISMSSSEIYLYISQVSHQAAEANTCHVGVAYDLLRNPEKIPKSWQKYILVLETIFVDKDGIESFVYLDSYFGKKELGFGFVTEGFITPPPRARFLCIVE